MRMLFWWDDLFVVAFWILLLPCGINVTNWRGWVFVALLIGFQRISIARSNKEKRGEL